ncbi:MAG: class I SAM-dependent methyltransferase [Patescibacteria group bacterium]|nr:class I SAM-dependent methyltransferase [Patescibacteria group bacterium]MDD5490305.1 class I SAM-dependent methyltransferase [Patescibacteria group bacterium]
MSKNKIKILDSRRGYDLAAADYDKKGKYLDSFEKEKLPAALGDIKDKKILDVGAGTGRLALKLARAGAEVTALDISPEMLKILRRKNKQIKTVGGDAEQLPFPDETFDIITAAFLIVHLKNPERFFDEAYRVLKNDGRLVITNINQKEPPKIKTKKGNVKIQSFYHSPGKIRQLLKNLAFDVQETLVKEKANWINQIIIAAK